MAFWHSYLNLRLPILDSEPLNQMKPECMKEKLLRNYMTLCFIILSYRLLDWVDRDTKRSKFDRIVILKNVFDSNEFEVSSMILDLFGYEFYEGKCTRLFFLQGTYLKA